MQSWILGSRCRAQGSQSYCQTASVWNWFLRQLAVGVQDIPKLALACWWAEPGPSQSQDLCRPASVSADCGAVVVLGLVSALWCVWLVWRLEQACWWLEPGILGLVSALWWVKLSPWVSGCSALRFLGLVPEPTLGV